MKVDRRWVSFHVTVSFVLVLEFDIVVLRWDIYEIFNLVSSIHDIHDHTQSDIGKDVEVIVADPLNINNQYSIGTFKFSQLLRENGRMVQSKATKTKVSVEL